MSDDNDSNRDLEWELVYEPPGSSELVPPGQRKILRASIVARLDVLYHRTPTAPDNHDDHVLTLPYRPFKNDRV